MDVHVLLFVKPGRPCFIICKINIRIQLALQRILSNAKIEFVVKHGHPGFYALKCILSNASPFVSLRGCQCVYIYMDSFNYPDLSSLLEDDITTDTLFEYDMYNTSQEHGLLEPAIETVSSAEGGEEIDAGVVDIDNDIFDFAIENVLSVEADEENENILFNRDPL